MPELIANEIFLSYELALLPLLGQDMTGEVNNTVFDYLSNAYGDGSDDDDD